MTANEFATLIYWWHGAPMDGHNPEHPNRIDEVLTAMESGPAKPENDAKGCFVAGVVTALETGYPKVMRGWRERHPDLALGVDRAELCRKDPEWVAFLTGHWLISHDPVKLDEMLDMIADGGDQGRYAQRAIDTSAGQCVPFKLALGRAREDRAQRMVIQ